MTQLAISGSLTFARAAAVPAAWSALASAVPSPLILGGVHRIFGTDSSFLVK